MNSVKDILKNSLYESLAGGTGISFANIFFILIVAGAIGIYIFYIYRLLSKSAFYSRDLNITMAGLVLVVAAIMIAMQSNLIVSLGMVGALSIVRFRNAIKNPMDLLFLFWATATGILCGVGLLFLAVITGGAMTILLLILESIPASRAPAVLVLGSEEPEADWKLVEEILRKYSGYCKEKSHNISKQGTEAIYELKSRRTEELLAELKTVPGLVRINYLVHDGELRL